MHARRYGIVAVSAAALVACAGNTHAQCADPWSLSSVTGPSPRQNHAAAFDSARNVLVLFGGYNGAAGGFNGETWTWNTESWLQVAVAGTAPSLRGNTAMAFDSVRGVVVLFGGATTGGASLGDTWEWNGTQWTERFPAASPPARFNHAMAFDNTRNRVVMTGGFGATRYNDTWEFDGTSWTQRAVTNYVARSSHAMAFDASRGRMVIFGGFGGSPLQRLADTWELTPGGWTQISVTGPSGRQYTNMDYDTQRHAVVLFGGQTGPLGTDRVNDLWAYDGAWTLLHPGTPFPDPVPANQPNRRDQHTVSYNTATHTLIVVGGYQGATGGGVSPETWTANCPGQSCYPNCDGSTATPILNVADFTCFLQRFAAGESYANCDGSTTAPTLNVADFTCFLQSFAAGCN